MFVAIGAFTGMVWVREEIVDLRQANSDLQTQYDQTLSQKVELAAITNQLADQKQAAADPTEKKQEVKDLMDLSFLYLFKGDSDKALQLLFQAKKLGEETQGGEKPAS